MQVQIKPAMRRLWRGPATIQIGLDPRFGTVLDGLTAQDCALLEQLGGGVDALSRAPRVPGGRDRQLLDLLADAGVLVQSRAGRGTHTRLGHSRARLAPDAAAWSVVHGRRGGDGWELLAARSRRVVEIVGGGRTGTTIAATLACSGIGRVRLRDPGPVTPDDVAPGSARPAQIGMPRRDAVRATIRELTGRDPDRDVDPEVDVEADVVVLVEHGAADARSAERLVGADVVHLSVVLREATIMVGPLVVPGSGPCLRCLDLNRTDRDPLWPRLLTQLLGDRGADAPEQTGATPEETASSQLAASLAALQVLGHLDGRHLGDARTPAAVGATLEVELPDGLISRREWPAHPGCGCHWPPPPVTPRSKDGRGDS